MLQLQVIAGQRVYARGIVQTLEYYEEIKA